MQHPKCVSFFVLTNPNVLDPNEYKMTQNGDTAILAYVKNAKKVFGTLRYS